jgi:hypothetical protein
MWKLTLGYGRGKQHKKKEKDDGGLQGARKHMGVPRRMPRSTIRAPISKPRHDINDGKHARALESPLRDIQK